MSSEECHPDGITPHFSLLITHLNRNSICKSNAFIGKNDYLCNKFLACQV